MPGVSKEQIEKARQVDLLTYLQMYEPDAITQTAPNEYCLKKHDSLKISNGKWNWFSRGFGGKDALTFLVKVRGVGFVEAVNSLCDGYAAPVSSFQPINPPLNAKQKPKSEFILPKAHWDNSRVFAYLLKRGIDKEIINRCLKDGILYEDKKYHNCIFVGKDKKNKPRFACARSTVSNFRQDIECSDKRFSFNLPASDPDSRFIMLAEAPIDILSLATMRKMEKGTEGKYHYLSLSGTSTLALIQYLNDYPKIDHIIVCLDNDKAGRKCMDKIKETVSTDETLKNRRITIINEPPPVGNDFNDTLLEVIQKQREENKIRGEKDKTEL